MFKFTSIFIVLALICVSAIGCGDDDPAAPKDDDPETTGTIAVDRSPNTLSCTWQITGPDSYLHNGTGDETLTDIEPGDYTLTWTAMSGWNSPSPLSEMKTVTAGATTTFTGTYVLQAGSITVNPEPNSINAPWTLTGPSSYSHSGTGDETIPGLTPGSYTITWGAVTDWNLPDPATELLVLADGGTVTFNGTYTEQLSTGRVHVAPMPPGTAGDATWHLDGPAGYSYDGDGNETLYNMDVGDYTVTWNELAGHTSPDPISETLTLIGGEQINFYGTYVSQTAQLIIAPNPSSLDAPWHIDGPGGFTGDGSGYRDGYMVPIGDYTITWGAVAGYETPPSEDFTVVLYDITRIDGNYSLDWDPSLIFVTGGKFEMGSPDTELGRSANENQHWVQVSDFYIHATEINRAQFASVIPEYTSGSRVDWPAYDVEWVEALRFCNALSAKEGLDSVYTITDAYNVTWDQNANGYRLPTEAEWEYACRAGATTAFANGEITNELCDDPVLDLIGWYCGNTPDNYVQDVGGLIANTWDLYDMHGNAYEWCWDQADSPPDPYAGTGTFENPDIDPTGPTGESNRTIRGGQGNNPRYYNARDCRSASRFSGNLYSSNAGFRIVRNAP